MRLLLSSSATVLSVFALSFIASSPALTRKTDFATPNPRIQAAILLDVSNSMDGLIDQAKNQLWNMVNVLSKVTCNGTMPSIEIALYEYGKDDNDPKLGYVKQITSFTNDMDLLFKSLIDLKTHGGSEYCGHVMYSSLKELNWDSLGAGYKVIFIAGNESFLQGDISFTQACEEAKRKGVVINTIYCGNRNQGIQENWNLGAECGNGSFTNIDQNAQPLSIPTPYDSSIISLKTKLNDTYIAYGINGDLYYNSMLRADTNAVYDLNDPTKMTQYVITKANPRFDNSAGWDLVAAIEKTPNIIDTVDIKTLDSNLKTKNRKELKQIVDSTAAERKRIQKEIAGLSVKQEKFIKEEKAKLKANEPKTLESEIEKIIREQVKKVNMKIE